MENKGHDLTSLNAETEAEEYQRAVGNGGEGLAESLHNDGVKLIKGKAGALFLPFLIFAIPALIIDVFSLGLLSPFTAVIWSGLTVCLYDASAESDFRPGFDSFIESMKGKSLSLSSALYRCLTITGTLLFILPVLGVRLNFAMFPLINKDRMQNGMKIDASDALIESRDMMKGHRLQYLGVIMYALPAVLLTVCTLGLISVWSIPYIMSLKAEFYLRLKLGELPIRKPRKSVSTEK